MYLASKTNLLGKAPLLANPPSRPLFQTGVSHHPASHRSLNQCLAPQSFSSYHLLYLFPHRRVPFTPRHRTILLSADDRRYIFLARRAAEMQNGWIRRVSCATKKRARGLRLRVTIFASPLGHFILKFRHIKLRDVPSCPWEQENVYNARARARENRAELLIYLKPEDTTPRRELASSVGGTRTEGLVYNARAREVGISLSHIYLKRRV